MAIKSAMINSKKETKVTPIAEILGLEEESGSPLMLVVTNTYNHLGAGNLVASWTDIMYISESIKRVMRLVQ